jgi:signal transduction histidine kinase
MRDLQTLWIDMDGMMHHRYVPAPILLNAGVKGFLFFSDPMLEEIFINLLDNTIRHGQRVTEILVSSDMSGINLVMVLDDNGVGIPVDEI